ncbi:MAG TPA: hypothetical protein VN671_02660, partial [Solirubrobacterales bacterium]|nr:hypothetical protein [Solirubrobacterales bacterium]
ETLAPSEASPGSSPGTPGREAEDVPVDAEDAKSASGDARNLTPSAPEADQRATDQEPDEGGSVLPFRKASGQ